MPSVPFGSVSVGVADVVLPLLQEVRRLPALEELDDFPADIVAVDRPVEAHLGVVSIGREHHELVGVGGYGEARVVELRC